MSTSAQSEPENRKAVKIFVGGVVAGLGATGAMFLWIFLNAMGHFNFHYWPIWYIGCAGFALAALLFFRSARAARQGSPRRIWFQVLGYVLAAGCGLASLWGIWMAADMQRARYDQGRTTVEHRQPYS